MQATRGNGYAPCSLGLARDDDDESGDTAWARRTAASRIRYIRLHVIMRRIIGHTGGYIGLWDNGLSLRLGLGVRYLAR